METGWLIERKNTGTCMCLGASPCGGLRWTVPNLAIRFAREQDAVAMAQLLVPKENTSVTEHQWG